MNVDKFDPTPEESRRYYGYHLGKRLKNRGSRNEVPFQCLFPGHSHDDRDASGSINFAKGTWYCQVCGIGGGIFDFEKQFTGKSSAECWSAIYSIIGRPQQPNGQPRPSQPKQRPVKDASRRVVERYNYTDEVSQVLSQVLKYQPKDYSQRRPDGKGGWIPNMNGVRRVPYDLPGVLRANVIGINEGEKDKHAFDKAAASFPSDDGKLVFVGTTNAMGALLWTDEHSKYCAGKIAIYVFEHNDDAGRRRTQQVGRSVSKYVDAIYIVRFTDLPEHGDVSDYLGDHTPAELYARMLAAPRWQPSANGADVGDKDEPEPKSNTEQAGEKQSYSGADKEEQPKQKPKQKPDPPWPDPEDLGGELPAVPMFDSELLPDVLRPWCIDIAELMQVPLDLPATAAVAALGAAVMRRAKIQPKRLDTSWTEYPNIWGAIVANPGLMKSPIIDAATDTIRKVEALWRVEYESELASAKTSERIANLKARAWDQQFVATFKKDGSELSFELDDSIPKPRQKRLLITDATFEKIHEILADNPAGIACWRDELTGWLAGLERPERKSERQFFLEGWGGHMHHTIDRIGRGSIFVPHLCVQVFGGIQPNPLRNYLTDVLSGGPTDDGLMQRFGLLVWPDFSGQWHYVDRLPNTAARQRAADIYQQLIRLDAENPLYLKYDPAAQELFVEFQTALEGKIRSDDTPLVMRGHLAKYRKLMPGLSLLFALADGHTDTVPLACAQRAAAWCEYLEPHAYRVYSTRIAPEMFAAQTLGRKLKAGWHAEEGWFTVRDANRLKSTGLTNPDEVRLALNVLSEYGWVRKEQTTPDGAGRPSEIYRINPKIKEMK